ncbi:MAG: ABC-type transport system substrate-binding protein [Flavobacteriales bacterium]|jgi:ABC-type transport system substrate-binding protein
MYRLIILFGIGMLLGCSDRISNKDLDIFRYNEVSTITSLDPAFAKNQANIWASHQLFNGLVQLNDKLEIEPCIAKAWDISEDGTTYTFHLNPAVQFHKHQALGKDSTRNVSAADFVYSLERLRKPELAAPGSWVLANVDSIIAINNQTLSIQLHQEFPPFLGLLSMTYCAVVPAEVVAFEGANFGRKPIGTGPFKFTYWKEGVKLVLRKNGNYFEYQEGKQLPHLDAIAVNFIQDKQTAFLEFIKGNLEFISGLDASYKDEVLAQDGSLQTKYRDKIQLHSLPYLNTEYLGFMVEEGRENSVNNRAIRKAINYGFDRKKMMQYLRNNIGTAANSGFSPKGLPSFDAEKVKGYFFAPDSVRYYLNLAGFPNGKGLAPIKLSTNSSYLDICEYIQSSLNSFGIPVEVEVNPPATLRQMVATSKASFFRASWIADYPDAENYLALFYSKNFAPNGPNYTHYKNTLYDALYEKAISITNDSVRYGLYQEMERILINDAPMVPLYYDQVLRFTQNYVHGLGANAMNLLTLKTVRFGAKN